MPAGLCPSCLFARAVADDDGSAHEPYVATLAAGAGVGPFTIVRLLGKGGMAAVYEAHDPRLDRAVALKVLPPEFLYDESFAARFQREARVVARLDHPAIVPIFASGIDEGIPWMSMRLATGGSLASLLAKGRLAPIDAVGILKQVAAAIDHAHARGVTHRDIKPANILLDVGGKACVADFGLAHLLEPNPSLTSTGVLTGTPHYMAPEQALGKVTGPACDIYSLGIVAYEMVVGCTPFDADSPVALLMKHVNEPLPDPRDRTVSPLLLDAIGKAASKEPSQRWESAGAFITALEAAFDGSAIPTPADKRAAPQSRVRRQLALTLLCTLLLAIGWSRYQARDSRPAAATPSTSAVETASPATGSTRPVIEPVRSPTASAAPLAGRPRTRRPAQLPKQPAVESVSPNVGAPEIPAAIPPVTRDSAPSNEPIELTAPIRSDSSPTILPAESRPSPPRLERFIAPVRLKSIAPNYPSVARAGQIEGDVGLQASVDRDGRVTEVAVTRSVHPLLDEAARQAVLQYEYAPARRDGIAEASTVRITVSFRLR
jgi:TonB family protein